MESFFVHYLASWSVLAYFIVFFGMFIEGEIFVFTGAFLTQRGFFNPLLMFCAVLSGMLIGDILWYFLGVKMRTMSGTLIHWTHRIAQPFDNHLKDRPLRTLFITKFTYGVHHAILLRAGVIGVDFRAFLKNDFISALVWVFVAGGAGYLSGLSFMLVRRYFHFAEIALIAGLVIFLLSEHFLIKRP